MKRSGRMDMLADAMAVELKSPAGQEAPATSIEEKHKSAKADLIKHKSTKSQTIEPDSPRPIQAIQLNPPHGEKEDFERMSITLPPEIRQRLLDESNRRKKERSPDWSISVIVREALAAYLK
jgi:hypothetical protein